MTDKQAKKICLILAIIFGIATIVVMTVWVIFEQLDLWVAIVGAVVTAGPCTVFVIKYMSIRRRVSLSISGKDGEGRIIEVGTTLNLLTISYTYADGQGGVWTKQEFCDSIKPMDIDFVKTLTYVPIRYFGKTSKIREAELFGIVQEVKELAQEDSLIQERAKLVQPKSINKCSQCGGVIDLNSRVCEFCDTGFAPGGEI